MQAEDAIEQLEQMFNEYDLSEYGPAWESLKSDWTRVCLENREMRESLRKEARKDVA